MSEYCNRIAPTNGQCGGFLRTDVAPLLQPGDTVGYLGDYDLAGGQIEANTQRVLEREIGGELRWERHCADRRAGRAIRPAEIIKRDRRYKDGQPHEAVETEAISQTVLIGILRAWLELRLPEPLCPRSRTRGAAAAADRAPPAASEMSRKRRLQMTRNMRFDEQDKRALRALDTNFTFSQLE